MYNVWRNIMGRSRNHCCHGDVTMGYFYFVTGMQDTSHSCQQYKNSLTSSHTVVDIFVRFLTKFGLYREVLIKVYDTELYGDPSSGSRLILADGQTDRHEEANGCFSCLTASLHCNETHSGWFPHIPPVPFHVSNIIYLQLPVKLFIFASVWNNSRIFSFNAT